MGVAAATAAGTYASSASGRAGFSDHLTKIEWLARSFFEFLIGFITIYAISAGWKLSSPSAGFMLFGAFFGLAVAGAATGSLLGFLFGIPRSLQKRGNGAGDAAAGPNAASAATRRAFGDNTNLEEISDWLTKIMVGLGLAQAEKIYAKVVVLALTFQAAMPPVEGTAVLFVLVLVSSIIGGFQFQYLETRTRVVWLLDASDREMDEDQRRAVRSVLETRGADSTHGDAKTAASDRELLKIPYEMLQTAAELAAWGSAQARAGNYQAANQSLRAAIAKDPGNTDYLVRLADVLNRQKSFEAAAALITEARQKDQNNFELLKREMLQSLYAKPPEGFQRALQISAQLLATDAGERDPYVQVWTAAAEGQRFRWLVENEGDARGMENARDAALAAVRRVKALEPDPSKRVRVLLQNMMYPERPGADPEDDDLVVFRGDPDFEAEIQPAP